MSDSPDAKNDGTVPVLDITFGWSSSPNYDPAVRLAKKIPDYESEGEGRGVRHHVSVVRALDHDEIWDALMHLVHYIGSWKSTRITLADRAMHGWRCKQEIEVVLHCYRRARQVGATGEYCSGRTGERSENTVFGCRHAKGVLAGTFDYHYDTPTWWTFGQLTQDNRVFIVDREAIFRCVMEASCQSPCAICPEFSLDRVRADIEDLPEEIDLASSDVFVLRHSLHDPQKPVGIRPERRYETTGIRIGCTLDNGEAAGEAVARNVPPVSYDDIGGQPFAVDQVRTMIQLPLEHPDYFAEVGVEPQRGVLLYGPPGNGKTLLAKAVAGESGAHFELINGPSIKSKWVGESEEHLRHAFQRARQFAPSVVLIDEIDSIAPRRDSMHEQHDISLVSQLLVLLDGMEERGQVVVVATTNRADAVDPAVMRPGRFDYHIEVPLPDGVGREDILRKHLAKMRIGEDVSIEKVAAGAVGFSGADLAHLCREAGVRAIRRALALGTPPEEVRVSSLDFAEAQEAVAAKRTSAIDM